ncbi:MAG: hypothetical protein WA063_01010 [Minisyncoccia bacterium]
MRIEDNVFEKEVEQCKKLAKKNNGKCAWGKCQDCGVLFLLYKLGKGKLIEDKEEIASARKEILGL